MFDIPRALIGISNENCITSIDWYWWSRTSSAPRPRPLSQHRSSRSLIYIRVYPPKIPRLSSPTLNRHLAAPSSRYTPPETRMHPYRPRRAYYYFCGAVSPTQCLVELQFRDLLSDQVRRVRPRIMRCYDIQVCLLDRLQPDAFMQERTQACPAQRWQFHTPHAQP